jgi:hypothetical protein
MNPGWGARLHALQSLQAIGNRAFAGFTVARDPACSRSVPDEPEPPRKTYGFNPREFERLNIAPSAEPQAAATNSQAAESSAVPRDVPTILRNNAAQAKASGLDDLELPPPRRSKRARDYIVVAILGNAALVGAFFLQPVFAGAGLVLFNVGLTWVMWFVMDDY